MRVLLVEDDSATAQSIELMLKSEGFNVYTTDLGEEAVDLGKIYDYDIILLDLGLPDMSGLDVLRQLRAGRIDTPVMIISGNSEIATKVKAFNGGADDYMTKPFHRDELVVRIQAIVRRSKGHSQAIITTGPVAVNLDAKTVEINGRPVHFTGKEYQMLELLSLRKGTTLTKEMFLNHLYGGMDEPELKIIDVFICKLRKRISDRTGGQHFIETVWGRGYVLRDPATPTVGSAAPQPQESFVQVEEPANTDREEPAQAAPHHIGVVHSVQEEDRPVRTRRPRGDSMSSERTRVILTFVRNKPADTESIFRALKDARLVVTIIDARNAISNAKTKGYLKRADDTYPALYEILPDGLKLLPAEEAAA